VNPRIGSGLKYGHRVEEEQTVEVVRNHAGGTRSGSGFPNPKEAPGKRKLRRMRPGVGLRGSDDGGAIFGQPQERKPGFAAGSQGPVSVGKAGAEVRRVGRTRTKVLASRPVEGSARAPSSKTGARRRAPRSRRAAVNGQGAAESTGSSPRRRYLPDAGTWSEPCPGAQAQHRHGGFAASAADSERQREERSRRRKALSPLKTR